MQKELQRRLWSYINVTFPPRQLYIRSEGRVQFFTFDPVMQAIFAGTSLLILGWVAFTSVNVIFKDRIIAAKERHFIEMQAAYENRIADLQLSYDELNSALIAAEDHFSAAADTFDAKQRALASLIDRKQNLQSSLGINPPVAPPPGNANAAPKSATAYYGMSMGGALDFLVPNFAASLSRQTGTGLGIPFLGTAPRIAPGTGALTAPADSDRPTFLQGAVRRIGELFSRKVSENEVDNPSLRHISEEAARLSRMDEAQQSQVVLARQEIDKESSRLTRILRSTGIDPKAMISRMKGATAEGGPLIEIGPTQIATPDPNFNSAVVGAMSSLSALNDVVTALNAVPLSQPLPNPELSSGFGARSDPFTESLAFHTGLDFPGIKGTDVHVTGAGVVIYAARMGEYGNTVEVDHGNRIHTRYAHLSSIFVPVGARINKGDVVGALGSTGRSTGPHLHYEVWYDSIVRDPGRFIRAGQDVLKN